MSKTATSEDALQVTRIPLEQAKWCGFRKDTPADIGCVNLGVWRLEHTKIVASNVCELHLGVEIIGIFYAASAPEPDTEIPF